MTTTATLLAQSRLGRPRARRARRGPTPEGALLTAVLQTFRLRNIPCWRIGCGAFVVETPAARRFVKMGDPGLADVVALVPGVGAVFVECKSARGKLSADQVAFRDACRHVGAHHVVCRRLEDLDPYLPPAGRRACP